MKFKRNRTDCSKIKNDDNPTFLLQKESSRLSKIDDLAELKEEMTKIINSSSISAKNKLKFIKRRDDIDTLQEMKYYLYNYILAGSAMQTKFDT